MDTGATKLVFDHELYKNQKLKLVYVKKISLPPRLENKPATQARK